jgi:hypothetical protein
VGVTSKILHRGGGVENKTGNSSDCANCNCSPLSEKNHLLRFVAFIQKSNQGFVTTFALTFLPILIFSGLSVLATCWFIDQKEQVQWTCESKTLAAQESLLQGVRLLLKLNPFIEAFVLEKKTLQLALLAAVTPADRALLLARLAVVRVRLLALKKQQDFLFYFYPEQARMNLNSLRITLSSQVNKMERQWNTHLRLQVSHSRLKINLHKKRIDELAHTYHIPPLFQNKQELYTSIFISGERLFPKWLAWISSKPLYWKESCNTKPIIKEGLWIAKLHQDKLS